MYSGMLIPFKVSQKYINRIFKQSRGFPFSVNSSCCNKLSSNNQIRIFQPILGHHAFEDERSFLLDVKRAIQKEGLLNSTEIDGTISCFLCLGRKLAGEDRAVIRSTPTRIVSRNSITKAFIPPPPSDVQTAIAYALRSGFEGLELAKKHNEVVGIALATYFLLITIHPLIDGNGRTARYYFSECLKHKHVNSPELLVALAMLHSGQSERFHIAARIAREGDFSVFMESYADSINVAGRLFNTEISRISHMSGNLDENRDLICMQMISLLRKVRANMVI